MIKYRSNELGKKTFIEEVIKPFVLATGIFVEVCYVSDERGEWIALYKESDPNPAVRIDITADSIAAIYVDFCHKFIDVIKKELY